MDEREFELVNIIGAQIASNQRDLSRQMSLSLGMTNMLIRRLLSKGYIRIKQLDKKKVQYILTPKGFSEKMQKSVKYTLKTISSIGLVKRRLGSLLTNLHASGTRKFYIMGESDLAGLIEIVLQEQFKSDYQVVYISEPLAELKDGVVLICKEHVSGEGQCPHSVNLIQELAKDEALISEGFLEARMLA